MKADVTQIPTKGSQSAEWLTWYISLKSQFGKQVANQVFLKAWKTRGSESSSSHELRDYLSKNGVDIDKSIFDSVYDTGAGVVDKIGGFLNVGKYVVYFIGGIVVIGIVGTMITLFRKPELVGQVAGVAAKAAI
jgi:hypothetical protein